LKLNRFFLFGFSFLKWGIFCPIFYIFAKWKIV